MALERQITFKSNVTKLLDEEINNYLKNNEVDPAMVQVIVDNGNGIKTATLTYADREALKNAYEAQGRKYSDSDKVTYVHAKDIILPFTSDLDKEVNAILSDENISVLSISRYFTLANQGAFILYIDLKEQKIKLEEKHKEMEKAQEELAKKLAQTAVKDVDVDTKNDTTDKYAQMLENTTESASEEIKDNVAEESSDKEENEEKEGKVHSEQPFNNEEERTKNKKFWRNRG